MSSEPSDSAVSDNNGLALKAPETPSKSSAAVDIPIAIRREERRMIRCILPQAKNNPELYQRVADHIKAAKISQPKRWRETSIIKNFMGWLAMTEEGARPDLERLVAVLAIFECYSGNAPSKFRTELVERGLRKWAIRQLERGPASTEQVSPEAPQARPKEPKVKQETILPSIETDQITPYAYSTARQGLKRQAEDHPTEHLEKRMVPISEHKALVAKVTKLEEALATCQRRMSFRDFGTQTSTPPTKVTMKLPSSVTEQLGKHNRALAEQGRALVGLTHTIREIVRKETHDAVHEEIQRVIAPPLSDASMFQRSQGHGPSYNVISNQAASSYAFDTAGESQMVEAPQGRAAGGRFNSRFFQPGMFDFDLGH